MTCTFVIAVALAALPLSPRAKAALPPTIPGLAKQVAESSCEVVRLTVRPMRAPRPALKYQLLPELWEVNPGNAAHNYLKCFMEQRNFFYSKEAVADRVRYLAMPLADLPVDKLRGYGGFALRQADWAARMDTLDWQDLQ